MTSMQADVQLLKQAIRQLSRPEREDLAEWMLNSPDVESRVAEAVLPYGAKRYYTVDEYLQVEEDSIEGHEYVAGYIYAMSSPGIRHEMIVMNVAAQFHTQLRGTPCRAFGSKMKLRLKVEQDDVFYIPDVQIACGPLNEDLDARWLTDPCVVVEVVSASTEVIDRREKVLYYRRVNSIEKYVTIALRPMEVTIFRRGDNWRPQVLTAREDVFESRAVEVSVSLANIYEGVQ
jgi:Uma2 family endonuclease